MIEQLRAHTREELLSLYNEKGYPIKYYDIFLLRYDKCYKEFYDEMKEVDEEDFEEGESARNDAYSFAADYMNRFMKQINAGHGKEWAHEVANMMDDGEDIVYAAYAAIHSQDKELARKELLIHCKSLSEDDLFEKRYIHLFETGEGWNHPQELAQRYARVYKQQIDLGKTKRFAHEYADLMSGDCYVQEYCEKYAETYDKAISEGKDETYARLFADKYGEGYANYGGREDKDVAEYWELQVFAYMVGWDYARQHNLPDKFINVYEQAYMNTHYADEPQYIQWDKFDEFVLEIALGMYETKMNYLDYFDRYCKPSK